METFTYRVLKLVIGLATKRRKWKEYRITFTPDGRIFLFDYNRFTELT